MTIFTLTKGMDFPPSPNGKKAMLRGNGRERHRSGVPVCSASACSLPPISPLSAA